MNELYSKAEDERLVELVEKDPRKVDSEVNVEDLGDFEL